MGQNCNVVILTPGRLTGELVEQARSITAKGGTIVATAMAPLSQPTIEMNLGMFSLYNQQLLGTVFGSVAPRVIIPKLLRLHHDGQLIIDDLVTTEYTIEGVNQGFLDMESGKNVRGVVRFD
jgi:S-(hydroxymethyl)glutathione dehydrogenase/alcohol dehydrogenase